MVGMDARDCFVGEAAFSRRGILKLKYPVEYGMVTNWNDFEKIMVHCYRDVLCKKPEEHPLFYEISGLIPKNNVKKIAGIMFESFNVPQLYLELRAVCSLYAAGKTTGVVLEAGDGVTNAVPIFDGYAVQDSIMRMNIAGRDMTHYMVKILTKRGYDMWTSYERKIVKDIKEKYCYVAADYNDELTKAETSAHCEIIHILPDGSKMTIGSERFRAPEILFQPTFIGSAVFGIQGTLYASISRCESGRRRLLYQNIVLSGGSTVIPGFVKRLRAEMEKLAPEFGAAIEITSKKNLVNSWLGGSMLSSLSSFDNMWFTKEEYDEVGYENLDFYRNKKEFFAKLFTDWHLDNLNLQDDKIDLLKDLEVM